MVDYERALYYFSSYLLPSWRLESAYQLPVRELNKNELQNLEEVLQRFCMKNDEPKLKLKYALTFLVSTGDLTQKEMEQWFHVDSGTPIKLWDLQSVVELCDRRLATDYCTEMKLFKNLAPLCNNAQNTVNLFSCRKFNFLTFLGSFCFGAAFANQSKYNKWSDNKRKCGAEKCL